MRKLLLAALLALALPSWAIAQIAPVVGASPTLQIKPSGGVLLDGYVTVASAGYWYVFNSATAPVNGSVTAGLASGDYQDCIYIANPGSYSLSVVGLPAEPFNAGIYMAWSSTGCGTLTLATPTFMKGRAQ